MMKNLVILMAAVVCISCASEQVARPVETEKTLEEARAEALAKIDQEACTANGGVVRPEGMLGIPRCVLPYSDAGKICRDSAECEGKCLASDDVTDYNGLTGELVGKCEADDSPFGCYAELEDGAIGAALCVD